MRASPHAFDEEETRLLLELAGDISFALDHIEKEERLNYLAYYDALTGLANRSLFLERVAQYLRNAADAAAKLAVGLIDLERFKNINHSLGRPAGDALLKQVADWLTRMLGDANLVARVDADHFAVVLPKVKHARRVGAARRERRSKRFLQHPFRLNDAVFRIAAKIGVALFPDDGADADTLVQERRGRPQKGQGGRRSIPVLRAEDDRNGGRQAQSGKSAARGARQGRIRSPLPAQDEPRQRQAHRRRGADPLE